VQGIQDGFDHRSRHRVGVPAPSWWTIGIILIVVGAVLTILGATGRAIGGRKTWS
jgi:hypothetical protein